MGKLKYPHNCTQCNKEYLSQKPLSTFCSKNCSVEYRKGKPRDVTEMLKGLKKWQEENPEEALALYTNNLPKEVSKEKNGNWKGGKTEEYHNYRLSNYGEYTKWRNHCLERDHHKCKICGSIENLQVHHIIPISESRRTAWLRMNGVTLCKKCHKENDNCWTKGNRFPASENLGSMFIMGRIIRSEFQEYPTCGNYQETEDGLLVVFITEQEKQEYVNLIFVHEIIEWYLCKKRGIKEQDISDFDIEWNRKFKDGNYKLEIEPGNELDACYHKEHVFAESIERQLCKELGLDWKKYENDLKI